MGVWANARMLHLPNAPGVVVPHQPVLPAAAELIATVDGVEDGTAVVQA